MATACYRYLGTSSRVSYALIFVLLTFAALLYYNGLTCQEGGTNLLWKLVDGFQDITPALHSLLLITRPGVCETSKAKEELKYVTLNAEFQGIDFSSLAKDFTEELLDPSSNVQALHTWKSPANESKTFPQHLFKSFLPNSKPSLGQVWWLIDPTSFDRTPSEADHERYEPLSPRSPKDQFFHDVFSMFHQNPFLLTRAAPRGSVAIVSGIENGMLDILFRMHVEFQLSVPPQRPFWFTPSQFAGRIIISENGSILDYFRMEVPSDRSLNVDLEWLTGYKKGDEETVEVDIGFVPKMSLRLAGNREPRVGTWDQKMDTADALNKLDQALYKFLEVPYYNLSTAAKKASAEDKLLHVIISWGALDDQSC